MLWCRFGWVSVQVLASIQFLGLVGCPVRLGVSLDTVELLRSGLVSKVLSIRVVEGLLEALGSLVLARFVGFDRVKGLLGVVSERRERLKEESIFVVGNMWVPRLARSNCSPVRLVLCDVGHRLVEQILAVYQPRGQLVV
jgi:hypothetical protein